MTVSSAIIEYCSPTLAGIKAASLFGMTPDNYSSFEDEVVSIQSQLVEKGLYLEVIPSVVSGRYLCFVYRTSQLKQILQNMENLSFLKERGYPTEKPDLLLPTLYHRLSTSVEFPHEIGLFLGYPLSDVRAFIENHGQNCLTCGCWKVYSNEADAVAQFTRCKSCTSIYKALYSSGLSISQLSVAA